MSTTIPTHRWRDTIPAILTAALCALFAMGGMLVHALVAVLVGALALAVISRLWGAYRKDVELGLLRRPRASRLKWFRRQFALRMLFLLACLAAALPLIGVLHFFGDAFWFYLGAVAVSVAWVAVSIVPRKTIPIASNIGFGLASLAVVLAWSTMFFGEPEPVAIDSPLRGDVAIIQGGPSPILNHHWMVSHQRYALDLVLLENDLAIQPGTEDVVAGAYGFGAPLLSPGQGRVVTIVDGRQDDGKDLKNPEGNHLVIALGEGKFVLYAHLKKGSMRVAVGDGVSPGQVIAEMGHSGNSGLPHLHIQIQDTATFDASAATFPIAIRDAQASRDGNQWREARSLKRGERLRSASAAALSGLSEGG